MRKINKNNNILNDDALNIVAQTFQALAVPIRLAILQGLQSGPKSVTEICEEMHTTQPNISKHLKVMLGAGLVKRTASGQQKFYEIADTMVYELCDLVCGSIQKTLNQRLQIFPPPIPQKTKTKKTRRKIS